MNVQVPSVRGPLFDVDDGVNCIALNQLPRVASPPAGFVVVGAGKTGMDTILWMLGNGVDPDHITWITPRDSWIIDRALIQPGLLANRAVEGQAQPFEAMANARNVTELFDALNHAGALLRIDETVTPTTYRCATVTQA